MALSVDHTDDFNRADGDLTDNGWSVGYSGYPCRITDQVVKANHPNTGRSSQVSAIANPDHWAELTVSAVTPDPSDNISPNVRMNSNGDRYDATVKRDSIVIWKRSGNSYGDLTGTVYAHTLAIGDTIQFGCQSTEGGVSLSVRLNDTLIIAYNDSGQEYGNYIPVGSPGINMWQPNGGTVGAMDDWRAGTYTTAFTANNVNTNNTIKSGETITISTSDNAAVVSASIDEGADSYALTLSYDSETGALTATPIDVMDTPYSTLTPVSLKVDTATETSTVSGVALQLLDTQLKETLTSVSATGLAMGTGAGIGDVVAQDVIASTFIQIDADGNATYDPAVPNGTDTTRYLYTARSWDSGPIEINQGAVEQLAWKATPAPFPATQGLQYDYPLGPLISGDRPITITNVGAALPTGITIDYSVAHEEKLTGIATESGTFTNLQLQLHTP